MRLSCLITAATVISVVDSAVKCFCDRGSCQDSLICTGDYCIIGLRKDGGEGESARLHQLCAEGETIKTARCEEQADGWQELCHCNEDFCNTFAYLRSSIDSHPSARDEVKFVHSDPVYPVHNPDSPARHQRSSLIVLLVIIPLSVGGLAVCLIFLNYHCKMC